MNRELNRKHAARDIKRLEGKLEKYNINYNKEVIPRKFEDKVTYYNYLANIYEENTNAIASAQEAKWEQNRKENFTIDEEAYAKFIKYIDRCAYGQNDKDLVIKTYLDAQEQAIKNGVSVEGYEVGKDLFEEGAFAKYIDLKKYYSEAKRVLENPSFIRTNRSFMSKHCGIRKQEVPRYIAQAQLDGIIEWFDEVFFGSNYRSTLFLLNIEKFKERHSGETQEQVRETMREEKKNIVETLGKVKKEEKPMPESEVEFLKTPVFEAFKEITESIQEEDQRFHIRYLEYDEEKDTFGVLREDRDFYHTSNPENHKDNGQKRDWKRYIDLADYLGIQYKEPEDIQGSIVNIDINAAELRVARKLIQAMKGEELNEERGDVYYNIFRSIPKLKMKIKEDLFRSSKLRDIVKSAVRPIKMSPNFNAWCSQRKMPLNTASYMDYWKSKLSEWERNTISRMTGLTIDEFYYGIKDGVEEYLSIDEEKTFVPKSHWFYYEAPIFHSVIKEYKDRGYKVMNCHDEFYAKSPDAIITEEGIELELWKDIDGNNIMPLGDLEDVLNRAVIETARIMKEYDFELLEKYDFKKNKAA